MLLHAKWKWPQALTANLWPYALHIKSISPDLNLFHAIGCPGYVLKPAAQNRVELIWEE